MSLDLKERINCFQLVAYDESDTLNFNDFIEKIKSVEFYSCKWYYAKHDKDINNETGELKKAHYHIIVKLDNAIAISNILKALSNECNYQAIANNLSIVKSFKGCVRYLIHFDDNNKYQYDLNIIESNDKNLSYYFNDNSIVDNFKMITDIVRNNDIRNMKSLLYYCIDNNLLLAMQYIQDNAYLVSCLFR